MVDNTSTKTISACVGVDDNLHFNKAGQEKTLCGLKIKFKKDPDGVNSHRILCIACELLISQQ